MVKHLPNAITCLNLFSGCMGVVFAFQNNLKYAGYAILVSAFLDFFDGMAARMLNIHSPMGKQLDSLADMVSFGLLPAAIMFQLIGGSTGWYDQLPWLAYTAFVLAIFSALRLAKFNVDTRQSDRFIGLPTPSGALVIMSLPYIIEKGGVLGDLFQHTATLIIVTFVVSLLLVAELPLLALKFKSVDFASNRSRYLLVFIGVLLFAIFNFASIPLIILIYILLSIIQNKLST
jgi:CDP-diacylglycerol--serine O-phosphatidyltransferase